jgi:spore coat protein H
MKDARASQVVYTNGSSRWRSTATATPTNMTSLNDDEGVENGMTDLDACARSRGLTRIARRPILRLAILGLALDSLVLVPAAMAADPATHGRDAVPNYARVFPPDRVTELRLQVTAADWQRLMDDMASMAGTFGGGGGLGGPAGGPGGGQGGGPGGGAPPGGLPQPSAEAISACSGKVEGDLCQFGSPLVSGRCVRVVGAATGLACTALGGPDPAGGPPGGAGGGAGGGGRDDVELLPRTPVYIPATVTFDGEVFPSVGLRLKGNSSLLNSWRAGVEKLPLRLNFDEFEAQVPEVRGQTFFGFQNINLNNNSMDASFLHSRIGHDLFGQAGVPSSATAFVRVSFDRGQGMSYLGLYTMVEIPGRALLNRTFAGASGNLYKPSGTGARWTRFVEESFQKETNERAADWSDVQAAITALNSSRADAAAWRSRLETTFNVQGFLRWLAMNTVIGNGDSYGGLAPHNYYLYGDPLQRDRLQWIPWDLDLAFGGMTSGPEGTLDLFHDRIDASWPLIRYLMDDPTYRASYRTSVEQILSAVFQPGPLAARLRQEHAMIAPHVVGPSGEVAGRTFIASPEEFDRALNTLVSYVEGRATAVQGALRSAR